MRYNAESMKRSGFTLVELLVVIGIILVLAALIFPVFATVRGSARKTVCLSNLRQLGLSINLYAADFDDLMPYGGDPSDKYTSPWIWQATPYAAQVAAMPLLNFNPLTHVSGVLEPYVKSRDIWRCPSDSGYDIVDVTNTAIVPVARPSAFDVYGTSYLFRTEIALTGRSLTTLVSYDLFPACTAHDASEVNVLMDGSGAWHGGYLYETRRYNVLMGDGHAVSQTMTAFNQTWQRALVKPAGCP